MKGKTPIKYHVTLKCSRFAESLQSISQMGFRLQTVRTCVCKAEDTGGDGVPTQWRFHEMVWACLHVRFLIMNMGSPSYRGQGCGKGLHEDIQPLCH